MKKLFTVFSAAFLASSASFAAEFKIEGDSTFDKGLKGKTGHFTVNRGGSKNAEYKIVKDEKNGQCLFIKTPAKSSAEFFLFQHVPVVKGKSTVKFTIWMKGKGTLTLCNYGYDEAKKYKMYRRLKGMNAGIKINAPDWKKYTFEYDTAHIDAGVKYIFLAFVVHKNSELYFDNFEGAVNTAE